MSIRFLRRGGRGCKATTEQRGTVGGLLMKARRVLIYKRGSSSSQALSYSSRFGCRSQRGSSLEHGENETIGVSVGLSQARFNSGICGMVVGNDNDKDETLFLFLVWWFHREESLCRVTLSRPWFVGGGWVARKFVTTTWTWRFSVPPLPYKTESNYLIEFTTSLFLGCVLRC